MLGLVGQRLGHRAGGQRGSQARGLNSGGNGQMG